MRIVEPINWKYDVTSFVDEMSKRENYPALFFECVKGYDTPLLVNVFGHIDRINLALEGASHALEGRIDFYNEWGSLIRKEMPPVNVEDGPVNEFSVSGGDLDLASLPIVKFYEQDAGRYITSGLLVARDPDNAEDVNLSYARMQLKGRNKLGTSLHSRGNMWGYFEKSKAFGKPLDVAVIIGAHPAIYLAAAAKITNEYSTAGALLGEPIELIESKLNGLPVPAQAEIVLEGRIALDEEDEGPLTEYTGYLSGRSTRNVIQVTRITRRRDAIYMTIAPSNSDEHLLLSGLPKQARIFQAMKDFMPMPALRDIIWPVSGTHYICFISLEPSRSNIPGLAKQIALSVLGMDPYVKIVAVFGGDVDISDLASSLRAVASRCDFVVGSDMEILRGVFAHRLDPSSVEEGVSSKMILDATGPEIGARKSRTGLKDMDVSRVHVIPGTKDASFIADDPRLCAISITADLKDKTSLLEEKSLDRCRLVVCVDDEIDIRNVREITWALATRFQPAEDIKAWNRKILFDATKPKNWKAIRATVPRRSSRGGKI